MLRKIRKYRGFYALSVATLFFSFAFNVFGAMSTAAFVQNFKDSEALVVNEVQCRGHYFSAQMLELKQPGATNVQPTCQPDGLKAYSSQFGLQGRLYTYGYVVVAKLTGMPSNLYIVLAQLTTALLSAMVLAMVAVWLRQRFGCGTAVLVVVGMAFSPMLVGFGRNLYWALPLMVLPFIYTLYYYRPDDTLKRRLLFWAVGGLLLYIRYLCGYEYLTSLTIMVAAAVGYHLWLARAELRTYVKQFAIVLAVSVLAFGLALGTHVISLRAYAGSSSQAVRIIKDRALERTTHSSAYLSHPIVGFKANLPDQYAVFNSYLNLDKRAAQPTQFWASVASFLNYAFLPVIALPVSLNQPLATYLQSLTLLVVVLAWLYVRRNDWVAKSQLRQIEGLFVGAAIGFVGFLSWMVLARSHALVHAHINGILLYLPFALFGYSIIGIYLNQQYAVARKRWMKR